MRGPSGWRGRHLRAEPGRLTTAGGFVELLDRTPAAFGALALLEAVAVADQGAFKRTEALGAGAAALVLLLVVLGGRNWPGRALWLVVPPLALAGWWLARAFSTGHPVQFLPLGSSLIAFAAAALVVASLGPAERRQAAGLLVGIATAAAAVGLLGQSLRIFPLAERAQDLWRVGSTLTYANAAGLLFALALMVALGLGSEHRAPRVAVVVLVAALVATESRGAVLGLVLASPIVPWTCWRRSATSLVLGVLAGLVGVAAARGNSADPAVLVAVLLAAGAVALPDALRQRASDVFGRGRLAGHRPGRIALAAVGGIVVVGGAVALGAGLATPLARRLNQDRLPEWSGAVAQWRLAPVVGVGPDRPIVLDRATETTAAFAQSEVLQVLADGGVVGGALLVSCGIGAGLAVRRRDALAASAAAALVVFGVAGAVDFDWHLPALALAAGWAAGLAVRPRPQPGAVEVPTDDQDGHCLS